MSKTPPTSDTPRSDSRTFVYTLDARDRIIRVNDAWLAFARENDATELTRAAVLRRPIWNFIEGAETRSLYHALFDRVRSAQIAIRFPFRCDSPENRRFMKMEMSPLASQHVRIACRIQRIEQRPVIYWPSTAIIGPEQRLVSVCTLCRKIQLPSGNWVEIEEATSLWSAAMNEPTPALSHGFCDPCSVQWLKQIIG